MAPIATVTLTVLILIFVIWAASMFHMLWRLTRRSLDQLDQTGGGYFTWIGHSLKEFFGALTSDKDRAMRRRILILTGLLILSIAVHSYVVTQA